MSELDNRFVQTYQQQKINYFMLLMQEGEDLNYIWKVENDEATLIYYIGNKRNIKVPRMIGGYPVKYIEATCYNELDFIQSVTIPEGVLTID